MKAEKKIRKTKDVLGKTLFDLMNGKEVRLDDGETATNKLLTRYCIGIETPKRQKKRSGVVTKSKNLLALDAEGGHTESLGSVESTLGCWQFKHEYLQSRKMEAMGELASGIVHDFNNFLTAIMGYQQLLRHRLQGDEKARHYSEQVTVLAEQATNLTQLLLAFSRKQALHPKRVNLNEVIRNTAKFLNRLIGEDIDLRTELHDQPLPVMAVAGQLEQILMNLVTNARDAMPKGGALRVETGSIPMAGRGRRADDCGENRPYAFLAVSDTGTGMDEKTKSRIFEPFFTTKEPGMGTGLGLATVRGIVEQHRGHINVDSEPGKGTKFSVFLPLIRNEAQQEETRSRDAPFPRGTETLLLAEDERNVREPLRVLLERQGYRVIEAADGDEALEKFMQHEADIDALILDVVMPRKNGMDVYEIIRKGSPDIKALFISGYTNDTIEEKGIVEAFSVVQKPLLFHEFLKTLREVLD